MTSTSSQLQARRAPDGRRQIGRQIECLDWNFRRACEVTLPTAAHGGTWRHMPQHSGIAQWNSFKTGPFNDLWNNITLILNG